MKTESEEEEVSRPIDLTKPERHKTRGHKIWNNQTRKTIIGLLVSLEIP